MRGYLLDLNHVSGYYGKNSGFMAKLRTTPTDTQIRVCSITLGECEAGLKMTTSTDTRKRDSYRSFVIEKFHYIALEIGISTAVSYAEIMSRIWREHPPSKSSIRTDAHLVSLGVDMNDVWLFAVAWEHGLILLTTDNMRVLRECVPEVAVDNWLT